MAVLAALASVCLVTPTFAAVLAVLTDEPFAPTSAVSEYVAGCTLERLTDVPPVTGSTVVPEDAHAAVDVMATPGMIAEIGWSVELSGWKLCTLVPPVT